MLSDDQVNSHLSGAFSLMNSFRISRAKSYWIFKGEKAEPTGGSVPGWEVQGSAELPAMLTAQVVSLG